MVKCPHEDCSNSDKEFQSDGTMRQHHTQVHNEQLPNSECKHCDDEFFRRGGGGTYCDDCKDNEGLHKGVNNPNYKGKADYIANTKKNGSCSQKGCDESRPSALCFHHKPESEKVGNVSRMAVTGEHSLKELKEEVEKCELICQNCHREKHADNKMGEDIEDHTINWDEYTETDMTLDGYSVFRNEASKKCILRECEYCDQMFMARVDSYENGRGRFHSLSCAGKSSKRNDKNTKRGLVKVLKREGECSTKDCDESRPHCLDFHHIDKENKDEHIRQIVENGDIEKLRSELEKCEFLCANCHQVNHSTNS